MQLVAPVQPSHGMAPGHMVIGQESPDGMSYYGFRFDPEDLPADFQRRERWQEYLYSHKTPGHIRDDLTYVQGLLGDKTRKHLEKRVDCDQSVETVIPTSMDRDKVGDYKATWACCPGCR